VRVVLGCGFVLLGRIDGLEVMGIWRFVVLGMGLCESYADPVFYLFLSSPAVSHTCVLGFA
jgi:hypothetical protein